MQPPELLSGGVARLAVAPSLILKVAVPWSHLYLWSLLRVQGVRVCVHIHVDQAFDAKTLQTSPAPGLESNFDMEAVALPGEPAI